MTTKRGSRQRRSQEDMLRLQNERLLALFQLAADLRGDLDPQSLGERAARGLQEVLPVSAALVWLMGTHRRMSVVAAAGQALQPDEIAVLRGLQVRSGEGLVGLLLAEGEPRLLEGADAHRATFGSLGRRREAIYRQLRQALPEQFDSLVVGMRDSGRLVGAIELFAAPGILTDEDLAPLQAFADQFGAALTGARLYAELTMQRTRLAAFDAVVTSISSASDLTELLSQSLAVVMGVVEATAGATVLVVPGQDRLSLAIEMDLSAAETQFLSSVTVQGTPLEEAVYYGQPLIHSVVMDGEELARAAIPLLAGGTVVGVLLLYGVPATLSSKLDWPSLMAVGSQIGIAIANARLYEESQRERRRLATMIASMADGVVIFDAEGNMVLANEAAAGLLGLSSLRGADPLMFRTRESGAFDLDGTPITPEMLPRSRALRGEIFHDYRLLVRQPRGDVALSFSGAPLRSTDLDPDGSPEGAVILFRDVTAQRQLEQAKDEFLAVAAHELRSPLAAIKGYVDLMLRRELRSGADERDLRGIRTLNQQIDHLVQLVDNLLDLSRLDAGRLVLNREESNLAEVVELAVVSLRTVAPSHTIELTLEESPLFCFCDSLRMRQVITNLLSNAVRYSPQGTQIDVQLQRHGREVQLTVSDHGPGIPPAYRERLFGRYYRVPGIKRQGSSGEGLGLGLYLSREIVLLHAGRIWVEETPGGGATFVVTLPIDELAAADGEQALLQTKEGQYALQG